MPNTKTSFRQFARLHRDRDDPIGDFCRDTLADPEFPKGRRLSWRQLNWYLSDHNACAGAINAARELWSAWQGQPLPPLLENDEGEYALGDELSELLAMGLTPSGSI